MQFSDFTDSEESTKAGKGTAQTWAMVSDRAVVAVKRPTGAVQMVGK